ncbi:hypothetical protein GCM10025858_23020 [Alicyclobacillus sacchari]|uniref:hypothetical protein n=1 Tax=Alicyclobacillus sacchari TaxID=392010 RepID=UPI0023E91238|nr:hypothetical protein [Alicyclobacillus sacchari]GMA57799.1 hypothetical protein GCM10025858_23020 [Alicyclobacillus sacchari]
MGKKTWSIRASIASAVLAASSCGVGIALSTSAQAASSAAPKVKIAFLMPETASSPRWEYDDRPDFIAEMKKLDPNAQIIYNNAQGSESTQLQQVESAITNGAQLLVVARLTAMRHRPSLRKQVVRRFRSFRTIA